MDWNRKRSSVYTLVLLFALVLIPSLLIGQKKQYLPEQVYSVEALQEDFNLLRFQLEEMHAGLFEYVAKADFKQFMDSLYQEIREPMTDRAFFRLINPLKVLIRNGHTEVFPSDGSIKYYSKTGKFLPYRVERIGDKSYITADFTADSLGKEGLELQAINGRPIDLILQELLAQETRDGYNLTYPISNLNRSFYRKYSWYHGYPDSLELTLGDKGMDPYVLKIPTLSLDSMRANRDTRYGKPSDTPVPLMKVNYSDDDKMAYLGIRSFSKGSIRKSGVKYRPFLKQAFKEFKEKKVEHLILDLRGNGGGDDGTGGLLFSYLYDKPFKYYDALVAGNNKIKKRKYFKEKLFFPYLFARLAAPFWLKKEGDTYLVKKNPGLKYTKPHRNQFKGELYVLIDGQGFSATGEIAGFIKHYNRGIFIGEEMGGNDHKNTSGIMFTLELPNTKNRVIIPFFQYVMNINPPQKGRGVIPDHPVERKLLDRINRKDVVFEYAVRLIRGQLKEEVGGEEK